jgi:lactoylglutathione lyase
MPRIVHIALKVDDLDAATTFYRDVFGFREGKTHRVGGPNVGHYSRFMTDGNLAIALMKYDSEDAHEATLAGKGPCIHHLGIEVDDRASYLNKLKSNGAELLSPADAEVVKFRSPDGTIAEIVNVDRYAKTIATT